MMVLMFWGGRKAERHLRMLRYFFELIVATSERLHSPISLPPLSLSSLSCFMLGGNDRESFFLEINSQNPRWLDNSYRKRIIQIEINSKSQRKQRFSVCINVKKREKRDNQWKIQPNEMKLSILFNKCSSKRDNTLDYSRNELILFFAFTEKKRKKTNLNLSIIASFSSSFVDR